MPLRFTKMHGAGNDFIVLDRRDGSAWPDLPTLVRMADRRLGIGCDQIMVLEPASSASALAAYRIINGDGSFARQCGNGVRCLAAWLHRDGAFDTEAVLDSPSGPVPIRQLGDGGFEVTLGVPRFDPGLVRTGDGGGDVQAVDAGYRLRIHGDSVAFAAVSIGNPHVVIEVDDVASAPVGQAIALQAHPAFTDGCNVGFAQVSARDRIRLRVVERAAGETLACGSGACAAHACLHRAGRVDASTAVELPGGTLAVTWAGGADEPVRLGGPTAFVFEGTWLP